ncbi:Uncharacterised protein [Vibrio cholerae]|nr:Uncharacterised protein [Vibrio cholerae]
MLIKRIGRWHRNDANRFTFGAQLLVSGNRQFHFRACCNQN